jgi:hypothetical protein
MCHPEMDFFICKAFFQSVIIKVSWISSLWNQYWTSLWLKEVFAGPSDNTNQRHEWYNLLATSGYIREWLNVP